MNEREQRYQNGKGKHQELLDRLSNELIPASGTAKTRPGELLRAAERLYYRWYNDGDRIKASPCISLEGSSAINAWNFLLKFPGYDAGELAIKLYTATSEEEYKNRLEEMLDAVLEYVDQAEPIPNDLDFCDHQYGNESNFTFVDEGGLEIDEEEF